ncbi:hypothetical protein OIU77_027626 [Salix suchowensis]|uniref:Uncharacterized protein n=1 Tax=Salix suchowensis TaxID=1278906 RepID=A0ABQ9BQB4_9ROSI|nr:hypothetical protein OIU77_027626 [Salix suchowensis]
MTFQTRFEECQCELQRLLQKCRLRLPTMITNSAISRRKEIFLNGDDDHAIQK